MTQVVTFEGYTPIARYDDVAWTEARIEEAATAAGTWAQIDEIELDPVDADPTHPATRNLTTELASDTADLWYRIIFADASGDTSVPTEPVRNAAPTAPTTLFASVDDFAARLGLTFTNEETTRATVLLGMASRLIQDETGQTIELVTDDVLTVRSVFENRFRLPQRPVVDVTSVKLDNVEAGVDSWYLDGDEIVQSTFPVLSDRHFFSFPSGRGWLGPQHELEVTYSHGYDDDAIPSVVKTACMEAVVRVWVNPGAVLQEKIGEESTVYAPFSGTHLPVGLLLTDAEKKALNDKLRRTSGAVKLR